MSEHLTASCVDLWILSSFSDHLFYRTPLGNYLFHLQVAKFQSPHTVNMYSGADPDYIHLCKCWSQICSGKVIKKYRNTRFLPLIILFFSSADRTKRLERFWPRYAVVILQNLLNVPAIRLKVFFPEISENSVIF